MPAQFHFARDEEEIYFFKFLKPKFTGELQYYKKLYQAILFKPTEKNELIRFYK